jgi:hypothetical protein
MAQRFLGAHGRHKVVSNGLQLTLGVGQLTPFGSDDQNRLFLTGHPGCGCL